MNSIQEVFINFGDSIIKILPKAIVAIVVLLIFSLAGNFVRTLINKRLRYRWKDTVIANFTGDIFKWIFVTLGIISALHIVGFGGVASSILAGAGVSAIIIGFAFKDIAENFLAGLLLALNRPFKLGDIIESDKFKGPVKKLDLRVTHIRTADGRDIYIPNSMIIKNVLVNYTRDGLIRHDFLVGLDTNDDLTKARNIVISYFTGQPDILTEPKPNLLLDEIGESSVNIKILFWVDMFKLNLNKDLVDMGETVKSKVMRDVKDLLLANGFSLPSQIIEHKMHKEKEPLKVDVHQSKERG